MKKLSLYLGGVGLLFLILILLLPNSASAKEGECHLDWCLVPAPTVLGPTPGEAANSLRPGIKGLTWKTTVVKVYLDGKELAGVKQVKHEDYYGSFFVRPDFDLKPGRHYVYTIAHSENPSFYDQSKESIYVYFNVAAPKVAQAPVVPLPAERGEPALPKAETSQEEPPTVEIISLEINPTVEVEEGKIEGGVSVVGEGIPAQGEEEELKTEETPLQGAATAESLEEILKDEFNIEKAQVKERQNRIIGLSMLGVVILIIVVWVVASRFGIRHEFSKPIESELPPPPAPPLSIKQDIGTPPIKDEEITIEPIKETENNLGDYWASPPPSPYSPYPPIEEEIGEGKGNERDRLI